MYRKAVSLLICLAVNKTQTFPSLNFDSLLSTFPHSSTLTYSIHQKNPSSPSFYQRESKLTVVYLLGVERTIHRLTRLPCFVYDPNARQLILIISGPILFQAFVSCHLRQGTLSHSDENQIFVENEYRRHRQWPRTRELVFSIIVGPRQIRVCTSASVSHRPERESSELG